MALTADANGVIKGKFTIPAGVTAGTKSFKITGAGGSHGEATFVGQGTLLTQVLRSVTTFITSIEIDPLAQTFSLETEQQLGGVELIVTGKGTSPIIVQIRETQTGFPTGVILAEGRLAPSQITQNAWNRFVFDKPTKVAANVEYAIVVLCNDAIGSVAVAELGKFDSTNQRWVTNQPYQVGVLLSSSNARTWTAHQDKDLTFRLLARKYSQAAREVSLGTVTVTNATDLVIMSMIENVATNADGAITLTLPDGTTRNAGDKQILSLGSPISGAIGVKATLRATSAESAVLHPGTQIAAGNIATTGNYVSRAIDADAAGANVRVLFNAIIPSGAAVNVFVAGVDAGDPWLPLTQVTAPKPIGDNVYEYQYLYSNLKEARVRVKLEFSGTAAARPQIFNLRMSTVTAT